MTIEVRSGYIPESHRLIENPTAEALRQLTAKMPNARRTSYDNYNVQTRVDARSTKSTYIVTDRPQEHTAQTVSTEEGRKWARIQDDYIRGQEMILLDGVIGNDPDFLTPARLIIEARNANVAGMQRHLYYPSMGGQPEITMIYTPNLTAPGYPNDRTTSASRRRAACGCGTRRSTTPAACRCTPAVRSSRSATSNGW